MPVLSLINLPLRATVAAVQALSALAGSIYFVYLRSTLSMRTVREIRKEDEWAKHIAYFSSNAFQNISRAIAEAMPILGNALCFMWDWQKAQLTSRELEESFGPILEEQWHYPFIGHILQSRYTRAISLF